MFESICQLLRIPLCIMFRSRSKRFWNPIEWVKMAASMDDFERPKVEAEKYRYFNAPTRNPLICCICDDFFKNPCLLSCYHSFCAQCLTNRSNNGLMYCPLCGYVFIITEPIAGNFQFSTVAKYRLPPHYSFSSFPALKRKMMEPVSPMTYCWKS